MIIVTCENLARLVLNFKGIDYQTKWLEYPDVEPTISSLGLPPNPEATPYTVPTVRLPNGEYVMDSRKIVEKLEQLHPSPPVHLDSPYLSKIGELWPKAIAPLRGCLMPKVPRALLNEASADYFYRTREQRFGMPLDQLEEKHGGDGAWEEARPAIEEVGKLLKAEEGPFILGNTGELAESLRHLAQLLYEYRLTLLQSHMLILCWSARCTCSNLLIKLRCMIAW